MRGFIASLLIGSLAFALAGSTKDNSSELVAAESGSLLGGGPFPPNVPLVTPIPDPEKDIAPLDSSGSDSQRVIAKLPGAQFYPVKKNGKVYQYQVPLVQDEIPEQFGSPYGKEVETEFQPSQLDLEGPRIIILGNDKPETNYRTLPLDLDNGKENTGEDTREDFLVNYKQQVGDDNDFTSIQTLQQNGGKQKLLKNKKVSKTAFNGNSSLAIEQAAGTGYHQVAHPHGHYGPGPVYGHHEEEHGHHESHEQGHHGPQEHGHHESHPQPHGPPHGHGHDSYEKHAPKHVVIVHHEEPDHKVIQGPAHHGYGHGHPHDHVIHHKSAKPLKPSIVHRDPHDAFDHHDKLRTLDKDHPPHHGHKGHNEEHGYGHGPVVAEHKYFQPYHYDMKKVPECAHKNKYYYNLTFCLEDHAYPTETILWALEHAGPSVHHLLSDVTYQSADNLVTGLTRAEEEGYTYKHYFGAAHSQHTTLEQYKPPYHGYKYKTDYFKKGGYICPSDIYYGRPRRAMNTYGKWKVIVNVDHVPKPHHQPHHKHHEHEHHPEHHELGNHIHKRGIHHHEYKHKPYTQTIRLEQCIYPNAPCSYMDPHLHSSCIQKHNFVRLVAWTKEEGLHVDTFKMPIACSCHIRQPIHFYRESGHHSEAHGHIVPPVAVHHGYANHHNGGKK